MTADQQHQRQGRAAWLDAVDPVAHVRRLRESGAGVSADMVVTLVDRAELLLHCGRRAEALAPAQVAASVAAKLDQSRSGTHTLALATSLTTLGAVLAAVARHREAVTFTGHAVGLTSRIASLGADDVRGAHAAALRAHARRLLDVGAPAEAVDAAAHSVRLYEDLDQAGADLAASLTVHAEALMKAGRTDEAVKVSARSAHLYERLCERGSGIARPGRIEALLVRADALRATDRVDDALTASQRALDLSAESACEYLRSSDPDTFLAKGAAMWSRVRAEASALARAQFVHAKTLADAETTETALETVRHAVENYRRLNVVEAGSYHAELIAGEALLAELLTKTDRDDEASRIRERVTAGRSGTTATRAPSSAADDLGIAILRTEWLTANAAHDHAAEGIALTELGRVFWGTRRYEEAIEVCQAATACHRAAGSRRGEGHAQFILGISYAALSRFDESIDACRQAAAISGELDDRKGEAGALNNLSHALQQVKRFEEAADASRRSAGLVLGHGDLDEGIALHDLGCALSRLGRFTEAVEELRRAVAVYRATDSPYAEGAALKDLGSALLNAGRVAEAVDPYRRAAALQRGGGDQLREGAALHDLARALAKTGQPAEARAAAQQAITAFQAIGDHATVRRVMRTLREITPGQSTSVPAEDVSRARVVAGLFSDVGGGNLADPTVQHAAQASLRLCAARIDRLHRVGRLRSTAHLAIQDQVSDFMDVFVVAHMSGTEEPSKRGSRFPDSPWSEVRDPFRHSVYERALSAATAEPDAVEHWAEGYINRSGQSADRVLCCTTEYLADALDGKLLPSPETGNEPRSADAQLTDKAIRMLIAAADIPESPSRLAAQTRALSILYDTDETRFQHRRASVFVQALQALGISLLEHGEFALARDFAVDGGGDLTDARVHNAAQAAVFTVEMGLTGSHHAGALDTESNNTVAEKLAWLSDDLKLAARYPHQHGA